MSPSQPVDTNIQRRHQDVIPQTLPVPSLHIRPEPPKYSSLGNLHPHELQAIIQQTVKQPPLLRPPKLQETQSAQSQANIDLDNFQPVQTHISSIKTRRPIPRTIQIYSSAHIIPIKKRPRKPNQDDGRTDFQPPQNKKLHKRVYVTSQPVPAILTILVLYPNYTSSKQNMACKLHSHNSRKNLSASLWPYARGATASRTLLPLPSPNRCSFCKNILAKFTLPLLKEIGAINIFSRCLCQAAGKVIASPMSKCKTIEPNLAKVGSEMKEVDADPITTTLRSPA